MNVAWRVAMAAGLAAALGGCSVSGLAPLGPAPAPAVPAAPPPPAFGAFLEGPVGQKLTTADRDKARLAEEAALGSGQRRTWRGEGGVYGFVEPAAGTPPAITADGVPAATGESCRDFTSTVYIGGRPQVGHGRGCLAPDGSYRIAG